MMQYVDGKNAQTSVVVCSDELGVAFEIKGWLKENLNE